MQIDNQTCLYKETFEEIYTNCKFLLFLGGRVTWWVDVGMRTSNSFNFYKKEKKFTEGRNTGHYLVSFFDDYKSYEVPVLSNQNKY